MRYYDREEQEKKKTKQAWGKGQLRRQLYISREEAERRALHTERTDRQLLQAGDKAVKRR